MLRIAHSQYFRAIKKVCKAKPTKPSVESIYKSFEQNFNKNLQSYSQILLVSSGLLVYTSLFAQQIFERRPIDIDFLSANYFKIKKSIRSNNFFTPNSCVKLCNALTKFYFDGDEQDILQKLRAYAKDNNSKFSHDQISDFNAAYKCIMVDKVRDPIKFKPFQIKNDMGQKQKKAETIKQLLKDKQVSHNISVSQGRIHIHLNIKVLEKAKKIKIISLDEKEKDFCRYFHKIQAQIQKYQNIILIYPKTSQNSNITLKQFEQNLFRSKTHELIRDQPEMSSDKYNSLLLQLWNKKKLSDKRLIKIKLEPYDLMNFVLQKNSIQELQQTFGYVKFVNFYHQFSKYCSLNKLNSAQCIKHIPFYNLVNLLEEQQVNFYNILTEEKAKAYRVFNMILEEQSAVIYLQQKQITLFLRYLIELTPKKIKKHSQSNADRQQIIHKLSLFSILYNTNVHVPLIQKQIQHYRKVMHPLTYSLFKDQQLAKS